MNEFYQGMKPVLVELLSLSKDAIHIHVGFLAFVAGLMLLRRLDWKALLFPLVLSLLMELLDFLMDLRRLGYPLWTAYLHDLINTNFIPVTIYVVLRRLKSVIPLR
jgi:hypothetical protein